jgi:uncharacterized protein YjbI with pentapeptide repeats
VKRKDLIDRWCTRDGVTAARAILDRLAAGADLADLRLPTVDGRLDLRGLPAGGLFTEGGTLSDADLSHCSLSSAHLDGVRWTRCRLDGADLSAAVLTDVAIGDSTLRRADLREALVVRSSWESVDVTGAKSRHLAVERTTFTRQTFPALAKVEFVACSFVDCRFAGPLSDVRFLGRGAEPAVLRRTTFESSDFRYAEFDGMEFDDVTFPDDGALVVVPHRFPAVADRASTLSLSRRDEVGKELRRFLSSQFLRPGLSGTAGWVLSRRDLPAEVYEFAASTISAAQED